MTELDEKLLAAAKLHESAAGDLDGGADLHDHAGQILDVDDQSVMSWLEDSVDAGRLGDLTRRTLNTRESTEAVGSGDPLRLSTFTGITEQDLDASQLRLPLRLLDRMDNHGAPCFITAAGNPNTGKTNTVALFAELRRLDVDDLLVLSNIRSWEQTDELVTSMHDLAVSLLANRDRPKFVVLDEGSTHMDARTYRREVATQYTPVAKRYAKLNVDVEACIVHTGKDCHPERKALTTTAFYKSAPETAEFFDTWERDSAHPDGRLFGGEVDDLERATGYDPDDAAPWAWDLQPELFTKDLDWSELLDELQDRGPA